MSGGQKFGKELVRQAEVALAPQRAVNLLGLSVQDMRTIGDALGASGFFSDVTDQAKAFTKILAGQELGIGPFEAMAGIDVIQQRLSLSAGLVAKLVKRSGRYRYRVVTATTERCDLEWSERYDDGWQVQGPSSFTIEEARSAGLVKPGGGWAKYPSDMLFARALTRGARRYAADALGGAVYTPEEIQDGAVTDAEERAALVVEAAAADAQAERVGDPAVTTAGGRAPDAAPVSASNAAPQPSGQEQEPPGLSGEIRALSAIDKANLRALCEVAGVAATPRSLVARYGDRAETVEELLALLREDVQARHDAEQGDGGDGEGQGSFFQPPAGATTDHRDPTA